jgi:excisionase family DNA binding protein
MDKNLKEIIKQAIKETIPQPAKATMTIDECAEFSGIGRNKLLELVHSPNSDFPWFKVGAKFLINREMVVVWLEKVSREKRAL